MKALIVDDSISVRKALERILSTRDVVTATAGSAEEALALLPHAEADIIITDVVMPGMSGFELCQHIKSETDFSGLPILLISGVVDDEVNAQAARVGASAIVTKPFTPDELFPKLDAALAGETLNEPVHEDDALLVLEDDLEDAALSADAAEPAEASFDFQSPLASNDESTAEPVAESAEPFSEPETVTRAAPSADVLPPVAESVAEAAEEAREDAQAEAAQPEPEDNLFEATEPAAELTDAYPDADLEAADLEAVDLEADDELFDAPAEPTFEVANQLADTPTPAVPSVGSAESTALDAAEPDTVDADTADADTAAPDLSPLAPAILSAGGDDLLFLDEDFGDEASPAEVSVPPAYVNTPAPQFEGALSSEALSKLDIFLRHPSVRAALVVDASGSCTAFEGQTKEVAESLATYVSTLMSIAGVLGGKLGAETLSHFHLEYRGASLVLFRLNRDNKLLLSLDDAKSLGVLHYLVRRYIENAGDAVAS